MSDRTGITKLFLDLKYNLMFGKTTFKMRTIIYARLRNPLERFRAQTEPIHDTGSLFFY